MVNRVISILALAGLALVIWHSILIARSDFFYRENSLSSAKKAVQLAPGNAVYHALLAEMLEVEGQNPDSELKIATELSPRESVYWIRRAFRAEVEQKYDESERFLTIADQVDRGFDPRWALMNYYFRRGNVPEFWKATREALIMSYGDRDPVFRLTLAMNDDPAVTRQVIPAKREILYDFFNYLMQHGRVQSAAPFAADLVRNAVPQEVPSFLNYCGVQIGHDDKSSLAVWNGLCRRKLVDFSELVPESGKIITNGDFSAAPLQQVFDWQYHNGNGVAIKPLDTTQGISVDIEGKQPDLVPVLLQEIPLQPGTRYILNYTYRLVGAQPDSGLQWTIHAHAPDVAAQGELIGSSDVFSATDWTNAQMTFSAGGRSSARLLLQYLRAPGTMRWKGTLELRRISSALAPADSMGSGPQ